MDLFTLVKAQGADDAASPTIPFPTGSITPVPTLTGPVSGPTISLATTAISLRQGDKATIQIVIDTKSQEVKAFTLRVSYNPQLFQIVDADPNTTGKQISYANTFFVQQTNSVDETQGFIDLKAASASGTGTISNKVIAQFDVTALANGSAAFQLVRNSSSLLDSNNTDILSGVNAVTINITNAQVTTSPTNTPTASPTIHPSITGGPITPRTALSDDVGNVTAIVLGSVLIIAGYYLFRKKRSYDLQR